MIPCNTRFMYIQWFIVFIDHVCEERTRYSFYIIEQISNIIKSFLFRCSSKMNLSNDIFCIE